MSFFCPDPYNKISTDTNGYWKACCISSKRTDMHINNTTFLDFYNSEYMLTLREHQKNGVMSDVVNETCRNCIRNENTTGRSRRTSLLETSYDLDTIKNIKIKHIGNLCNLKCIMCIPSASSMVAQEAKALGEHEGDIVISQPPTQTYLDGLAEILPKVQELQFVGGEPIVNKLTWEFIEWLTEKGFFHLRLKFTTNCTRSFTDHQKKIISKFSSIKIIASIDSIGPRNDYIRFPSNFDVIEKNMREILGFVDHLNIYSCVTMLNVGYVDEVVNYFSDIDVVVGDPITEPDFLRPENLPYRIKTLYDSKIPHIQKTLETEPNHSKFIEGLLYLKKRDEFRGNNLFDLWPEFEEYYENIICKG